MGATTHEDLLAWQEAMALVELVYRETATFPRHEMYGLTVQIRRAAISVPSNIAEGAARKTSGEFLQFLGITCGSIAELETQLELARRLGFLDTDSAAVHQAGRVGSLVRRLRASLKSRVMKVSAPHE